MQMDFLNEDLDLTGCANLSQAAESTWIWMADKLNELDDDDRRQILDLIMDDYIQVNPGKCPELDGEQTAAINEGAEQGRAILQKRAENRPVDEYEPAQWMQDAMAEADRNINQPPEENGANQQQ